MSERILICKQIKDGGWNKEWTLKTQKIKNNSYFTIDTPFNRVINMSIFIMNLNKVTHNETERYLVEVSQSISTTINVKCKSIFRTLYSMGDTYFEINDSEKEVNRYLSKN